MKDGIKQVMAKVFDIAPAAIPDNASINNMESWDSFRHITFIFVLEETFNVRFNEQEIMNLTDIDLINRALKEKYQSDERDD